MLKEFTWILSQLHLTFVGIGETLHHALLTKPGIVRHSRLTFLLLLKNTIIIGHNDRYPLSLHG